MAQNAQKFLPCLLLLVFEQLPTHAIEVAVSADGLSTDMAFGNQTVGRALTPAQIAEVVLAHNKKRCMHGVPNVAWNAELANLALTFIRDKTKMEHDPTTYNPPLPAGENLAGGSTISPSTSVQMWYDEVDNCRPSPTNFVKGCKGNTAGASGTTGHFTAMIWKATQSIGCAFNNARNLYICRYYSGPGKVVANMQGAYEANVLPKVKSEADCGDPSADPSPPGTGPSPPGTGPSPPGTGPSPPGTTCTGTDFSAPNVYCFSRSQDQCDGNYFVYGQSEPAEYRGKAYQCKWYAKGEGSAAGESCKDENGCCRNWGGECTPPALLQQEESDVQEDTKQFTMVRREDGA